MSEKNQKVEAFKEKGDLKAFFCGVGRAVKEFATNEEKMTKLLNKVECLTAGVGIIGGLVGVVGGWATGNNTLVSVSTVAVTTSLLASIPLTSSGKDGGDRSLTIELVKGIKNAPKNIKKTINKFVLKGKEARQ